MATCHYSGQRSARAFSSASTSRTRAGSPSSSRASARSRSCCAARSAGSSSGCCSDDLADDASTRPGYRRGGVAKLASMRTRRAGGRRPAGALHASEIRRRRCGAVLGEVLAVRSRDRLDGVGANKHDFERPLPGILALELRVSVPCGNGVGELLGVDEATFRVAVSSSVRRSMSSRSASRTGGAS